MTLCMRLVLLTPHTCRVYNCEAARRSVAAEFLLIPPSDLSVQDIESIRTVDYAPFTPTPPTNPEGHAP